MTDQLSPAHSDHLDKRGKSAISNLETSKRRASDNGTPMKHSFGGPRVPLSLQQVILASNRGEVVDQPPSDKAASKIFFRNWAAKATKVLSSKEKKSTQSTEITIRRQKDVALESSKSKKKIEQRQEIIKSSLPTISPQAYLNSLVKTRGYSMQTYAVLSSAYYNQPTELQLASYQPYLLELVRTHNIHKFRQIIRSGISINPCNSQGDSLVHVICRQGDATFLSDLADMGCSFQIADQYGRTPLHDACRSIAPSFDIIELLLRADQRLLHMMDCYDAVPLSYVRREHWPAWLVFLQSKKDVFWPLRNKNIEEDPPYLATLPPNSCPCRSPQFPLRPEFATLAASGTLELFEAELLRYTDTSTRHDSDDDDDDDIDDEGDDDTSYNDLNNSCYSFTSYSEQHTRLASCLRHPAVENYERKIAEAR